MALTLALNVTKRGGAGVELNTLEWLKTSVKRKEN
jgi:hypothetical protein